MKEQAARELVLPLNAAFPMSEATFAFWVHRLMQLDDVEAAEVAIYQLINSTTERWLPAFGAFLVAYRAALRRIEERRARERALPETPVDFPAQAAKARELLEHLRLREIDDTGERRKGGK